MKAPWAGLRDTPGALWVLYLDTFTMAVGFYMLIPLLAFHLLENLSLSIAFIAVLTAVRSAAQNGLMPITGWIADRIDYKRAILGGVLIRAAGFAALGTVDTPELLLVASILTGLGGALFHPASYAAYSALAEGRDTVRVYSTRELVSNVGFIVGPVIGGLLAGADFALVSFGAAGLFLTAFFITLIGLPSGMSTSAKERTSFRTVFSDRPFMRFCLVASGMSVMITQLYLVVPIRARDVLPGPEGVGLVYTGAAVLMVFTMLPTTKFATARFSSYKILAFAALALGSGLAVMGLWSSIAGLLLGVGIFTVGQMLAQPVMNAVAAGFTHAGSVASYFGVLGLAHAVGGIIGTTAGGFLYTVAESDSWASSLVWWAFPVWALIVGTAFVKLKK
ncbi:MFS transporter [Microbacterium sp. R86528]|uniref:MFS transporter n=1 Tax=Microbacterium sp. R86528 TaxID=3093864 RepID=UPI0037C9F0F9